jgi:hypothetical protein
MQGLKVLCIEVQVAPFIRQVMHRTQFIHVEGFAIQTKALPAIIYRPPQSHPNKARHYGRQNKRRHHTTII